ncbi:sensor histidine kinase [Ramlibacter algicola]|uniref:histidine kinase n=1 Tax=Ramlibacter algicola TaxID=2795217 RepID=A0A934UT16_9BURK|nr:ATP-binding protein [Ramlibacter algicola]MBK0394840.1 hypothetical protein [Ramlibacter algicola]
MPSIGRPGILRRSLQPSVVAGSLVFALVAALAAGGLLRERHLLLEQAHEDAAMLASVLEENTARTFESVDIAIAGLAQHLASSKARRHDPAVRELMRAQLRHLPTVRALYIVGPDGFVQHDTDYPKTPDVSLADRSYFRAYLEAPTLQRHVSEALQSRSGTGWFVASSRRITRPDGSFGGVAVAAVQLGTVSHLYRKLGLGSGRQLTLFHKNGRVLAGFPHDSHVGRSYAQLPVFADFLHRGSSGQFETDGAPWKDMRRIVAYRALDTQPLVVVVAVQEADVLASWSRTATGVTIGLLLLAMAIGGVVLTFEQRQEQRRRAAADRVTATESAAVAERMRAIAAHLQEADQRKTQFLATLSHELRNAMGPVLNALSILDRSDPASAASRRARDIMREQVGQLRSLVDDLLDISRVNSGKVRLDLQRLDLGDVVGHAAAAAQAGIEALGHVLVLRLPDPPLWIVGDRARLAQVVANLLGNAAKYTPRGNGRIEVEVRREGSRALVSVRDNGLGIPAADLGKVFGMFEQVERHQSSSQGGLGIGLALVARLVALQGGEVAAHSDGDGRGSTFTVSLPLVENEPAPTPDGASLRA